MKMHHKISLKPYNTFGVEATAKALTEVSGIDDVHALWELIKEQPQELFILGGGSNVLFTKKVDALVVLNRIKGIERVNENDTHVFLKVGAGEIWHDFVEYCIEHQLAGVENLALIPGNVGASPMQNIGAYGTEIVSVFYELEALHLRTGELHKFAKSDCAFGYRESVFKNKYKGDYIITNVTFALRKEPEYNVAYGAISQQLEKSGVEELSLRAVADAVIAIRQSKLPDPGILGNAGSFFKNPVVTSSVYERISAYRPDAPNYPAGDGMVKLAAGWLIEQAGWKGLKRGNCGVHEKQALVLVNYGGATGSEIYALSTEIMEDVEKKFGVRLEREVNII